MGGILEDRRGISKELEENVCCVGLKCELCCWRMKTAKREDSSSFVAVLSLPMFFVSPVISIVESV